MNELKEDVLDDVLDILVLLGLNQKEKDRVLELVQYQIVEEA